MGNVTKSNGHRYEQGVSNGGRAKGGVLIILHAIVIYMTIELASLQRRDGARRVFDGPGSQSIKREAPLCVRRVP